MDVMLMLISNRLDPGQLLGSWSKIQPVFHSVNQSSPKQEEYGGFEQQTTLKSIFRKLPSIQRVKTLTFCHDLDLGVKTPCHVQNTSSASQ